MKELWNSPYRNFFIIGLFFNVVASWFSMGFHQIDEHFMILEFANYKFASVPQEVFPWEFTHKIRPTLQPTFAHFAFQFFKSAGISNVFFQVFLLRLFSCLLAWFVSFKIALRLAINLKDQTPKLWWIGSVTLLWFMPYLNVRFSSENFAGITFLAALLVIPNISKSGAIRASYLQWTVSGLLLGLSFYFRFQMAFAIIGLLFWIILYARPIWKPMIFLFIGAIIAVAFNLFIDHWFYGEWVFTPYNYYLANITNNVASSYGTTPWYDYFFLFASQGIPPISWVLLLLFFIGIFKRPLQIMVFVFVPFLIGHMMVPHKEFRFLYPMIVPFLFICFSGLQSIWHKIENRKWTFIMFKILLWVNFLLLGYRCIWPAKPTHFYYKFLNNYAAGKPLHLVTIGRGIFDEGFNEIYLYRPANFTEDTISESTFKPFILNQQLDSVLVLSYQAKLPFEDSRYTYQRLYVYLPDWIMSIKMNDWQSRSDIWSVWLLRKKK